MQGEFCRRESEDQPVVAGIDERVLEHIPEERSVGLGNRAVENDMAPETMSRGYISGRSFE
jgi:hypothetical protein